MNDPGPAPKKWDFVVSVQVSSGLDFATSRAFGLGLLLSNARARGLVVDEETLTHHSDPVFPGDPSRRVWKARASGEPPRLF